jgi:hypothetical protein
MTNSDWWDRAKLPPRPQPIEIRRRELLCTLHRDAHEITLGKRDVPARRSIRVPIERMFPVPSTVLRQTCAAPASYALERFEAARSDPRELTGVQSEIIRDETVPELRLVNETDC